MRLGHADAREAAASCMTVSQASKRSPGHRRRFRHWATLAATTCAGACAAALFSKLCGPVAGGKEATFVIGRRVQLVPQRHLRGQRRATWAMDGGRTPFDNWQDCVPDFDTTGKLRALGRLFRIASQKLNDAELAKSFDEMVGSVVAAESGSGLRSCASVLRAIADSLLQEQWAKAYELLGEAKTECVSVFPQEHLSTLQQSLCSQGADSQKALASLGQALEGHAEGLSKVCDLAQDALIAASAALHAASRLFSVPAQAVQRPPAPAVLDVDAILESSERLSVSDVNRLVARTKASQRNKLLRKLARKFHPDSHPGSEMEVLPLFLHVQKLREDLQ
eukprot:TRINITY_DN66373_c0_g1_i1.p1 TRINITY_DN66373_c0_g1~~TRINITY_DN66373_c0_g1_i1.p1  ORF type:complete len:336 (-),score=67.26 TRINITY_DN66373_c0_g1_i1:80-1087(-)